MQSESSAAKTRDVRFGFLCSEFESSHTKNAIPHDVSRKQAASCKAESRTKKQQVDKPLYKPALPETIPPGTIVLIDLDGTLVDTDYANYLAYRRAILDVTNGAYDVKFDSERLDRNRLRKEFPTLTDAVLEQITSLKSKYFRDYIAEVRLNESLAKLIRENCGRVQMILVTECRRRRATEVLEHYKLSECFTRLICYEDISASASTSKYAAAIEILGADKKSVWILDDSDDCIQEALRAGVPSENVYKIHFRG